MAADLAAAAVVAAASFLLLSFGSWLLVALFGGIPCFHDGQTHA